MSSSYPFGNGRPLHTPYRYAYVPVDRHFVPAWAESRARVVKLLADLPGATPSDTWFNPIHERVLAEEPEALADVDRLLHGFEVGKRVFDRIDGDGRPAPDADGQHLPSYVGFARLLVAAHSVSGSLTYLNGLIKTLDLLCSLAEDLDPVDQHGLRVLIEAEGAAIEELGSRVSA